MVEIPLTSGTKRATSAAIGNVARIRIVTGVGLLMFYELVARSGLLYGAVVPSLLDIVWALMNLLGSTAFYPHLMATVVEVVAGFLIGTCLGLMLGISFGLWRLLGEVLDPWIHYLAPTPKIIFLPILILLFGAGMGSKIAMGAVSAFFPVVVATYAGMRLVRPVLIRVATSFQATSWQLIKMIYLPSLIAPAISAMRIGLGATIIGTLLAEIKMSREGIGFLIALDYSFLRVPEMYSLLIVVFVLALLANSGMELLGRKLARR